MVNVTVLGIDAQTASFTNNYDCPMARAINRLLKRGLVACVGGHDFGIQIKETGVYIVDYISLNDWTIQECRNLKESGDDKDYELEIPEMLLAGK